MLTHSYFTLTNNQKNKPCQKNKSKRSKNHFWFFGAVKTYIFTEIKKIILYI